MEGVRGLPVGFSAAGRNAWIKHFYLRPPSRYVPYVTNFGQILSACVSLPPWGFQQKRTRTRLASTCPCEHRLSRLRINARCTRIARALGLSCLGINGVPKGALNQQALWHKDGTSWRTASIPSDLPVNTATERAARLSAVHQHLFAAELSQVCQSRVKTPVCLSQRGSEVPVGRRIAGSGASVVLDAPRRRRKPLTFCDRFLY